jgi:periplasmic protein TonB
VDASFRGNRLPIYPTMSRRLGEQGTVTLRVLITPEGQAAEIKIIKSSGSARLDQSAIDAIRVWRFVPAQRAGQPIAEWYEWRWEFRLDG